MMKIYFEISSDAGLLIKEVNAEHIPRKGEFIKLDELGDWAFASETRWRMFGGNLCPTIELCEDDCKLVNAGGGDFLDSLLTKFGWIIQG